MKEPKFLLVLTTKDKKTLTFFNSFSLHSFSHTKETSEFPGASTQLAVIFPRFLNKAVKGISCSKAFHTY